ncbi:hypothetical protein ACFQ22_09500 [Lentilactobacillus raoultii]|uniref:Uncharacterized protein n=1 Tax=Lentilactobacillus raoultii TaxID=1987503 RepID=A0ABW3PHG8_9LACO|nr:hypothetical protein [Lentilactobacillus raoultii]
MQTGNNPQIKYDLSLIKKWQAQLGFSDDQVQSVLRVANYATFMAGKAAPEAYDPATDRFRKVAFQRLMPNLDMRSAYLLNGIKFEIRSLKLTPDQVQKITGVTQSEYDQFLAGQSDRLLYEDAFDRMGVYYYQHVGNQLN